MSELISSGGSLGGTIKLPQVWVNFHDLYQWWKKRLVFAIGRDVFSWELRYPFLYKPPLKMLFPFPEVGYVSSMQGSDIEKCWAS